MPSSPSQPAPQLADAPSTTATVHNITAVAEDLAVIEFSLDGDAQLTDYSPGCHVDITLPGANGEMLTRQYSVFEMAGASSPAAGQQERPTYGVAVKREKNSTGGSIAMLKLRRGDSFKISQAFNNFELVADAGYYVLVGAGVGITPMLSMAQSLERENKPYIVLFFARDSHHAVLLEQLRETCGDKLIEAFGRPRDKQADIYRHLLGQAPKETAFYVCGPQGFMDSAKEIALDYLPDHAFHWENFRPDLKALSGEKNAGAGDGPFEVEFCGETVEIPENKTVLEVLEDLDLPVKSRCLEGTCSTCLMRVVEGEPDHRDSVYDAQMYAEGAFAPCVSRALSPKLTLERWRQ